jgi:hypothetical protein
MPRGAKTFTQGDVTRALKAAEKAGLKVHRTEVRQDGSILLDFDPPTTTPAPPPDPAANEWDTVK